MIVITVQAKLGSKALPLAVLVLALSVLPGQRTASPSESPGAIDGTVLLAAALPRPQPQRVSNTTDPEVCGLVKSLGDLLVSEAGGVAHVIVSLTDVPAEEVAPASPRRVVLDNRDCQFYPRSIVLRAGDILEMRNNDPTLHTVHWYGPHSGNIALPMEGMRVERPFPAAGIYQIKCDVHGWMQAFLRVDPHRYHAVSAETGGFKIEGVPAGAHMLEAWHERLGFLRQRVEIGAGSRTSIRLTYSSPPH